MSTPAYVEHVAIWVKDIRWHIRFFREVLGMTMREVLGSPDEPEQYWALGGLQFMARTDFDGTDGRLGHIGVMCEDVEAALVAARIHGATDTAQGRNWLRLPEGLVVEFIQAKPGSVAKILAVDPRS